MRSWLALSALFLLGCTSARMASAPRVVFTSFGAADPTRDTEVVKLWKADRDLLILNVSEPDSVIRTSTGRKLKVSELAKDRIAALKEIEVLVDTVPAGIELEKGSARATADSGFTMLGQFSMRYGSAKSLKEGLDDVRVLVRAAGGKLAIISWQRADQDSMNGVAGLVFDVDPSKPIDRSSLKKGTVDQL